MASALPGQLGPVRPLGWQRVLSARGWCPVGGGPASLGSAWGSLCPACFVLIAQGGRSGSGSAILQESLLLCPSNSPLCAPQTCTHIHKHTHTTLIHTFRDKHTHTPMHSHSHSHLLAHSLCLFLCLTHTPCLCT